MRICVLDPGLENNNGILSSNLGDIIIQEAVKREIIEIFSSPEIINISTQYPLQEEHIDIIQESDYTFVGGTNILSSYMDKYKQWNISIRKAFQIKNAILFGVGWWQYQNIPNFYTRLLLYLSLSQKQIHSVRDSYTLEKLKNIGFKNVINTGCPTMWPLACNEPINFPNKKSENVLLMLTDYYKNIYTDKKLLDILFDNYNKVYFWPQGRNDIEYIKKLRYPVLLLDHSLDSLKNILLSGEKIDCIGTRLHGGIQCLLMKKRVLVLVVDNRAKEISNDTNLNVLNRDDFVNIKKWIYGSEPIKHNINTYNILQWKNQFI
jgi:hypothetical protein